MEDPAGAESSRCAGPRPLSLGSPCRPRAGSPGIIERLILPVAEGDGEGDHAKHGGGALLSQQSPSTALRAVPLPMRVPRTGRMGAGLLPQFPVPPAGRFASPASRPGTCRSGGAGGEGRAGASIISVRRTPHPFGSSEVENRLRAEREAERWWEEEGPRLRSAAVLDFARTERVEEPAGAESSRCAGPRPLSLGSPCRPRAGSPAHH